METRGFHGKLQAGKKGFIQIKQDGNEMGMSPRARSGFGSPAFWETFEKQLKFVLLFHVVLHTVG